MIDLLLILFFEDFIQKPQPKPLPPPEPPPY